MITVITIAALIALIYQQHEINECYLAAIQSGMDDVNGIIKLCNH